MARGTGIEWASATWNPLLGCTKVSPGCQHCYAMRTVARLAHVHRAKCIRGETSTPRLRAASEVVRTKPDGVPLPVWNNQVRWIPETFDEPFGWAKPQQVFVNAQSDLFHPDVPDDIICRLLATMGFCSTSAAPDGVPDGSRIYSGRLKAAPQGPILFG